MKKTRLMHLIAKTSLSQIKEILENKSLLTYFFFKYTDN